MWKEDCSRYFNLHFRRQTREADKYSFLSLQFHLKTRHKYLILWEYHHIQWFHKSTERWVTVPNVRHFMVYQESIGTGGKLTYTFLLTWILLKANGRFFNYIFPISYICSLLSVKWSSVTKDACHEYFIFAKIQIVERKTFETFYKKQS